MWTQSETRPDDWSRQNGAAVVYMATRQSWIGWRANGAVVCDHHGRIGTFRTADDAMEAVDGPRPALHIAGVPLKARAR